MYMRRPTHRDPTLDMSDRIANADAKPKDAVDRVGGVEDRSKADLTGRVRDAEHLIKWIREAAFAARE
jgi:hypothetical protein